MLFSSFAAAVVLGFPAASRVETVNATALRKTKDREIPRNIGVRWEKQKIVEVCVQEKSLVFGFYTL